MITVGARAGDRKVTSWCHETGGTTVALPPPLVIPTCRLTKGHHSMTKGCNSVLLVFCIFDMK